MKRDEAERLTPLLDDRAWEMQRRLAEHGDAPAWTVTVGDHITAEDVAATETLRSTARTAHVVGKGPPPELVERVGSWADDVPLVSERIDGLDLQRDWNAIAPTTRQDLATALVDFVPDGADLDRIIVYDTSGTTGHAIDVPSHPRALALSHALMEAALKHHGVDFAPNPADVACVHVCAKRHTYVFSTTFSVWNGAGFAKVNLRDEEWPKGRESARRFFADLAPKLLTGDPISFEELMAWDVAVQPLAMFSSAVSLSPKAKVRFEEHFGCPVIDWFSTTETGPLLYSHPDSGYAVAASDLYLEVLDEEATGIADGWGELCVTGGRNPYLPLLRYKTGDRARVSGGQIQELEGRAPVWFKRPDGGRVNAADVGRALRPVAAFLLHRVIQHADLVLEVRLRPFPGVPISEQRVHAVLKDLFGAELRCRLVLDSELGGDEKVVPYRSEA